ncbi:MAG: AMP-binding protein [Cyanobacteriota bacterium]|nr:AMP-binding protein [Cyanobacteriota bacterium]
MNGEQLEQAWAEGRIVPLAVPELQAELAAAIGPAGAAAALEPLQRQWGPGVLVGSGGSSGHRRWCLQPLAHLRASAVATATWLRAQGLDPAACLHLNPLPLHHVSGLMPLVRARLWGCGHGLIAPETMRDPAALAAAVPLPPDRPALISLVPTQLQRLMAAPAGLAWLRQLAVIWVGGAPLPDLAAAQARSAGLRLAPCYGATETAAMVCVLSPLRFLDGVSGCGQPLADVQLQIAEGHITVGTPRLSPGWLEQGVLRPLPGAAGGRWCSGDGGRLMPEGLQVLGRLDGAIHSGGETVFPEVLEGRLMAVAQAAGLPLVAVLLLAEQDPEWGERLVALVRLEPQGAGLDQLVSLTRTWTPAERPRRWLPCPQLACPADGKWQRGYWRGWLRSLEAE